MTFYQEFLNDYGVYLLWFKRLKFLICIFIILEDRIYSSLSKYCKKHNLFISSKHVDPFKNINISKFVYISWRTLNIRILVVLTLFQVLFWVRIIFSLERLALRLTFDFFLWIGFPFLRFFDLVLLLWHILSYFNERSSHH